MSLEHSSARKGRKCGRQSEPFDPLLSFAEASAELGVSVDTFKRRVLPTIPVVHISPNRLAVRLSVLEGVKDARTIPARNEAAAGK